jgi:hypothetical protein
MAGFFIVSLAGLILALKDVRYGLMLAFAELFIGSMGRLFYLEIGGLTLSVRISLWLIIMSVWLGKTLIEIMRTKKIKKFFSLPYGRYFYSLFIFIALGVLVGHLNHNQSANIFFDVNNWLYLAYIFPIASGFKKQPEWQDLLRLFIASCAWLGAKTLLLLYSFSHNLFWANLEVYKWIRQTGVGEITEMQSGWFRLFFQSHIYIVFAFCFLLPFFVSIVRHHDKKNHWAAVCGLILSLTIIVIGMSRSFWVGLGACGAVFVVYLIKEKISWQNWLKIFSWLIFSLAAAFVVITVIVKFPFPTPGRSLSAWDILNERSQMNESAVSSRWNLLPKLWDKIKASPLTGSGFGTTVSYKSSDPRVLEQSADGSYETYAFEWGWLDLWLKLGLVGVIIYLIFLFNLIRNAWLMKNDFGPGIALFVFTLAGLNFFTPYLNHPLGLGALMLAAAWLYSRQKPDYCRN